MTKPMLKLGQEIGISPIKCENKEGTEALKTLHFKINDVLYAHTYRYIFPATAARLLDSLTSLGVELKDLQVPDKAAPKKEEILVALRAICRSLKECIHTPITEEDLCGIQKTLHTHIFRKSYGSYLLYIGVPIEVISKTLGHSSVRQTEAAYADLLTLDICNVVYSKLG